MIGVVLTGHGQFAPGLADSMNLIIGAQENFAVVAFTPELAPEALSARLLAAVQEAGGDETLILCDLAGGTPFNETLKLLPQLGEHVEVLAGVNLPALMEACTDRDDVTVSELVCQLEETGRGSLSRFVLPTFDEDDLDE